MKNGGATLRGVETFAAGDYPGDAPGEVWSYTDEEVAQIVRNFALLSKGETPLHRVPVVVTHDKAHAYGWVADANKPNGVMTTDWEKVEPSLRQRIKAGRLVKVSPEIKRDFTDKDGTVYPGPYLYRVAVLGADVPRVKGLADLPESFADRQPGRRVQRPLKFAEIPAEVPAMTREQAIQYLTEMGIDPAVMGPDVPDAFLIAVATAWQEEDAAATDTTAADTQQTAMADRTPAAGQPKKVSVTQTYTDPRELSRFIRREIQRATDPALKRINDAAALEAAAREQRAAEERRAAVRLFCDQRAKEGRISPADNDEASPLSVRSRLLRLAGQPQTVHKFADPSDKTKEVSKTELQLQQEEIDARPARKFSESVRQGGAGAGGTELDYAQRVQQRCAEATKRAADRGRLRGTAANN
jgi:hypothetical protein